MNSFDESEWPGCFLAGGGAGLLTGSGAALKEASTLCLALAFAWFSLFTGVN